MRKNAQQLKVRMPDDIKGWLIRRAADNGRSQNAEILQLMRKEMAAEATSRPEGGAPAAGNTVRA